MNSKGRQRTGVGERHLGLGSSIQKSTCYSDTVTLRWGELGSRKVESVAGSPFSLGLTIPDDPQFRLLILIMKWDRMTIERFMHVLKVLIKQKHLKYTTIFPILFWHVFIFLRGTSPLREWRWLTGKDLLEVGKKMRSARWGRGRSKSWDMSLKTNFS